MSTWLLFLIPSSIWGTTWLVIKFQLGVVAPEVSVVYRFGLASAVLFAWCAARKIKLRFDARTHSRLAIMGALQYGLNYVLVYSSEKYLTSGLIAVIYVLLVLWTMLGGRLLLGNELTLRVAIGGLVGMAGVLLVFWPEASHVRGAPAELAGVALAIAGSISAAAANLWSQREYARGTPVASSTAWAMGYATTGVALYCVLRGIPFRFDDSLPYVASLAYLALFGSVIAFIGFLTLLRRVGAGRAGYTAAVIPVLAMVTSTLFEGYRWSAAALSGMMLVALGNVLVLRKQSSTT